MTYVFKKVSYKAVFADEAPEGAIHLERWADLCEAWLLNGIIYLV